MTTTGDDLADRLSEALLVRELETLLVVTGAGISTASGIPTFRGAEPDAVWRTNDVSLATRDTFERDPVGQWTWYLRRFEAARSAQPNRAHEALAELEQWMRARGGDRILITQNIDTLHEQAGSQRIIKVHGSSDRVRCSRNGCRLGAPSGSLPFQDSDFESFRAAPASETLPRCPECSSLLRAHVLFFDEFYLEHEDYRFQAAEEAVQAANVVLFIGTSFSVGITDLCLQAGLRRRLQMFSVDPRQSVHCPPGLCPLMAKAEELLPATMARLSAA